MGTEETEDRQPVLVLSETVLSEIRREETEEVRLEDRDPTGMVEEVQLSVPEEVEEPEETPMPIRTDSVREGEPEDS